MKRKSIHFCAFLALLFLTVNFSSSIVEGYVVESLNIGNNLDPITSVPVGTGEIFLTETGYVYCVVNLTDVQDSLVVRFDWFNPMGELYASVSVDTEDPGSGSFFESYPVYGWLGIYGNPAEDYPGRWSVRIFIDDFLVGTEDFIIVDYDSIIEKTSLLEYQLFELNSSFYQLFSQVDNLRDDYQDLLVDYNELSTDYDNITIEYSEIISVYSGIVNERDTLKEENNNLTSEYNDITSELNQLTEDYNGLLSEYESIEGKLGNSRNIMYASIGLTVIIVIAAIYLYTQRIR
jgi:hypothetical protein